MTGAISFLVPTFNRAAYLAEALEAILHEAEDDDEVLVIDDGSSDNTREVVEQFSDRVSYIRQENSGKSVALNRGMAMTDRPLVWICDDDDKLLEGARSALIAPLADERIGFSFGRYYPFREDENGRWQRLPFHWPDLSQGSIARHLLEDSFIMQNASLVRRECYDAVGPFNTEMLRSLDYEMFVRLILRFRPWFVDREIFAQRKHEGARGPQQMRHTAGSSESVWLEFDQKIFETLQSREDLWPYAAMFEAAEPAAARRAAMLQRACVSARHGLWTKSMADVLEAARLRPSAPLDATEVEICGRFLGGKYNLAGADNPQVAANLAEIYKAGGIGADIVASILGGGLWRYRRRAPGDLGDWTAFLVKVLGIAGTANIILNGFFRRKNGVRKVDEISEIYPEEQQ